MEEDIKEIRNNVKVERRRFPRLNTSVDIDYSILEVGSLQEKKTVTKNIGAGGICLIAYEKIEPGALLDLRIHLRDINYIIETKGRVIWSAYFTMSADNRDRYDLGIEFIEIKESDCQKISQYILNLLH